MPTCLPKNHKIKLMKSYTLKLMKHLTTFEETRLKKMIEVTRHILNVKVLKQKMKGTINSMMKALQKILPEMGYHTHLDQMTMTTLAHLAKLTLVHLGS